jgi:FtsH-binding integral membrane protein
VNTQKLIRRAYRIVAAVLIGSLGGAALAYYLLVPKTHPIAEGTLLYYTLLGSCLGGAVAGGVIAEYERTREQK